jgi:hypothetical protein
VLSYVSGQLSGDRLSHLRLTLTWLSLACAERNSLGGRRLDNEGRAGFGCNEGDGVRKMGTARMCEMPV